MPSSVAQAQLIRDTYARAGLDINDPKDRPQFFHAHGTGTQAGDPQESEAIARSLFEHGKPTDTLYVGSIKTVVGYVLSDSLPRRLPLSVSPCTHTLAFWLAQTHRGCRRSCQLDRLCHGHAAWHNLPQSSFQEAK